MQQAKSILRRACEHTNQPVRAVCIPDANAGEGYWFIEIVEMDGTHSRIGGDDDWTAYANRAPVMSLDLKGVG